MPTWICPNCLAKMTVKESHIGKTAPCVQCGTVSTVADVAEIIDASGYQPPAPALPPINPTTAVPASTINRIRGESPTLVAIWKIAHVLTVLTLVVGAWYLHMKTRESFWWMFPIGGFVSLVLWWPVYEFMSDVYRCRRLLEEIAKK